MQIIVDETTQVSPLPGDELFSEVVAKQLGWHLTMMRSINVK